MNKLIVIQMPKNGWFGGPKEKSFSITHQGIIYEVMIKQCVCREITITATMGTFESISAFFHILERLLMLLDGQFYPVERVTSNGEDITDEWKNKLLDCYSSYDSADFVTGDNNTLVNYIEVLDEQLLLKWISLEQELDLIHKMVMYCLSSVKMPKEMQCAFMVESFNGLKPLVKQRHPGISFSKAEKNPETGNKESQLKVDLKTLFSNFGVEIFRNETGGNNAEKFAQILVNTRNRIAHIKSKQNYDYLEGSENLIYLIKLSLLYRVILFSFLDICPGEYNDKLTSYLQIINEREEVKNFLRKLSGENANS